MSVVVMTMNVDGLTHVEAPETEPRNDRVLGMLTTEKL
jgi:hypothetical protein